MSIPKCTSRTERGRLIGIERDELPDMLAEIKIADGLTDRQLADLIGTNENRVNRCLHGSPPKHQDILLKFTRFVQRYKINEEAQSLNSKRSSTIQQKAIADIAFQRNDYLRAVEIYAELIEESLDDEMRFLVTLNLIRAYISLNEHKQAIRNLDHLSQMELTDQEEMKRKVTLGRLHFVEGNWYKTKEIYDAIIADIEIDGDIDDLVVVLLTLIPIDFYMGYIDESIELTHRLLWIGNNYSKPNCIVQAQNHLAHTMLLRSDFDAAEEYLLSSMEICNASGSKLGMNVAHTFLGDLNFYRGDEAAAEENYMAGLSIAMDSKFRDREILLLSKIMRLKASAGLLEEAQDLQERMLRMKGLTDSVQFPDAMIGAAYVDLACDRFSKAIGKTSRAIEFVERRGHQLKKPFILLCQAAIWAELGDVEASASAGLTCVSMIRQYDVNVLLDHAERFISDAEEGSRIA